jgi:hypothetical protein
MKKHLPYLTSLEVWAKRLLAIAVGPCSGIALSVRLIAPAFGFTTARTWGRTNLA